MKEWQRTVILIILFIVIILFLLWTRNQISVNFLENF